MGFSVKPFKNNCMLSDYKQLQAVKMWSKMGHFPLVWTTCGRF